MVAGDSDPPGTRKRRVTQWLALVCVVVALGTLYPWRFAMPASFSAAWHHATHRPSLWTGTRDVIVNLALFVPIGALGFDLLRASRWSLPSRAALVLGAGFVFAFALQVGQIFVPRRDAAWSDVVWNTAGLVAGVLIAMTSRRR